MARITDKKAWLEERRTGLGGSDIAKICNLSKWGSAIDVYLDKKGKAPEIPTTLRMEIGTDLEPTVTRKFIECADRECIEYTATIHGQGDKSFMLGDLDRIVVEPWQDKYEMVAKLEKGDLSCVESILECKTASRTDDWYDDQGNLVVPEYYKTQVLWYMGLIPSCKRVYVAVIFTGLDCKFDYLCVERKDSVVNALVDYAGKWWRETVMCEDEQAVLAKLVAEAPSIKEVVAIYPESDPEKTVTATPDILAKIEESNKLKSEIEEFEAQIVYTDPETGKGLTREGRIDAIEADIAKSMGEAEVLVAEDGITPLVTFKKGKDTVKDIVDWEAVARELVTKLNGTPEQLAEIAESHTQKGVVTRRGSRPVRFVKPKVKKAAKKK